MPSLGVQLTIDNYPPMKNVSLTAVGNGQDLQGWRRLEQTLAAALAREAGSPNLHGVTLLLAGLLLMAGMGLMIYQHPQEFVQSLADITSAMLRTLHL
jgi:hypothetical protein